MTAAPAAAGQPGRDDLTSRIFQALYQDFNLRTIHGIYVVVPTGVPCFASSSLGEIARQISEYEYSRENPAGRHSRRPRVAAADQNAPSLQGHRY
jgi:hypothetical protein